MLAIDLVRFCREMLKRLSKCDIKTSDYRLVDMCDEYRLMAESGHKKEYIIAVLREKYGMSESTLRRALKRLCEPDNPFGNEKIWSYING